MVTTLSSERRHNRLLSQILDPVQAISTEDYLSAKEQLDAEIDDASNCELVCGHIQAYAAGGSSCIDVSPSELPSFFEQHADSLIVDVREAHEFHFTQDWRSLGLASPPRNVPLTRFADFLADVLRTPSPRRDIIFLCRSGNRSGKAAQVVRRLGVAAAWHIAGGIALGSAPTQDDLAYEELEYAI